MDDAIPPGDNDIDIGADPHTAGVCAEVGAVHHRLDVIGLSYSHGGQQILSNIDLSVDIGESLAITGPSGSGKSSLLAVLGGLALPDRGEIRIDGVALAGIAGPARGVALVLQGYGLVSLLTASENVEIALRAHGRSPQAALVAAREALEQVGLEAHLDHLVEELSGGQQQRTAIARALAARPRLLLADEPTAELDPASRAIVLSRIFDVVDHGGAIVLATHDPDVADRCTRTLDLRHPT